MSTKTRSSVTRIAAVLCGIGLLSCADAEPGASAEPDDAAVAAPATPPPQQESTSTNWAPYTVEEARALRDSFRWGETVALPEEPLSQRSPDGVEPAAVDKAALSPIAQIMASLVSLSYVQIYIRNPDHLRELEEIGVHWDLAPLFDSELPDDAYTMSFEGDPQDTGGMFVYTFMPAAIYNAIRAAALLGDDTYPAMILRTVPVEARAWDGSVKWEYLAGALLSYAPSHTHLTDLGETPFPSVLDAEFVDGAQEKRFGRRLRKWARKARDVVRPVVDGVRQGVGALAKFFRPEVKLTVLTRVKNHDSGFTGLNRAWDRYGSAATYGRELKLQNTRINVTQLGGISLFPAKTDAKGVATVSVPKNRKTRVCAEADSPTARMEAGLLWPVRSCVSAGNVTQAMGVGMLLEDEFSALAQLQDAREFSTRALQQTPRKATVQVGWPAALITSINEGRAFVPCLEATNGPVSVANLLSDLLNTVLPASGTLIEFLITSDMILPKEGRRDRVTPSHEYGHFLFCDLLNRENSQTFNYVWSAVIKDTLPTQKDTEVTRINEGFADWFASQVTGGVSYFQLEARSQRASSNGPFFDFQAPGAGLGMEENVGTRDCVITGPVTDDNIPRAFPFCQHSKLTGLDQGTARFATLLHDVIDRKNPNSELTGDAAVWRFTRNPGALPAYVLQNGPWQTFNDEVIEMPAKSLINGIRDFAKRNGVVGTRLTWNDLLYAITSRLINVHNYSREQVCELVKLHQTSFECSTSVVPGQNPPVIGVF